MKQLPDQSRYEEAQLCLCDGRVATAFRYFEQLVRQTPANADMWFGYGAAALRLGRLQLAEQAWSRVEHLSPENGNLLLQIGHQYNSCRQRDIAIKYYNRAARQSPGAIDPKISLAVQYEQQYQFDSARKEVEQCLALNLADEQARYMSALLDLRQNDLPRAEATLRDLLHSEPRHEYVRYSSRHLLAEICDRTERYDDAMTLLTEAKRLMTKLVPNIDNLIKRYDRLAQEEHQAIEKPKNILAQWKKTFPESKRNSVPPLAFLGGHPRSGTTLLEQVLDAHPEIAAADEPHAFITRLLPAFQREASRISPRVLNTLRNIYIDSLKSQLRLNGSERILLDKNPSPTSRLPVWLRVFPELHVIIALRDPRDVVISSLFQNLPLNPIGANFLSIERIAIHYANLMDIWLAVREWEGFHWLETRYEDMVADVRSEGAKVTEFLGLRWNDRQEQFYIRKNRKEMYSPSYHQVAEKPHNRSIGRWKHYERYLEPVLPMLEPYLAAFHYD